MTARPIFGREDCCNGCGRGKRLDICVSGVSTVKISLATDIMIGSDWQHQGISLKSACQGKNGSRRFPLIVIFDTHGKMFINHSQDVRLGSGLTSIFPFVWTSRKYRIGCHSTLQIPLLPSGNVAGSNW